MRHDRTVQIAVEHHMKKFGKDYQQCIIIGTMQFQGHAEMSTAMGTRTVSKDATVLFLLHHAVQFAKDNNVDFDKILSEVREHLGAPTKSNS